MLVITIAILAIQDLNVAILYQIIHQAKRYDGKLS